jgi:hypothetical protein
MKALFSWSALKKRGRYYMEANGQMFIRKFVNDEIVLWAPKDPDTHLFNIPIKMLSAHTTFTFWHKALGHHSHDVMRYLDVFSDGNQVPSKPSDFDCASCLRSKSVHHVPKLVLDKAKNTFDVIHSDGHGPLAVQSLIGKKNFVTFIDQNSRYTWIYFLRHKLDVKSVLRDFWNLVETQFSTKIKKFKSDNGGKYVNKDVS